MKLVGIGDLFIPPKYIESGFQPLKELGVEISVLEWELQGFQELQKINSQVEQGGSEAYEPPSYIYEAVKAAEIIITQFCPLTRNLIDRCPRLKAIGVLRAGYENVNVAHATEREILVFNTPGRNADAVADFTVGLMIAECRNIAKGHLGLKNGLWIREYPNSDYIPDLPGKTVGIIGLGEIGQKVAKRLSGFEMELLGYDPYVSNPPPGVELVGLEELISRSDFVTVHVRLTKETEKMVDRRLISLMKPTAYFINTSRSGVTEEQALYEALRDKKIAGAALDVFDKEPPGVDYPLVQLENVTLTPHMAGGSKDAFWNSPQKLAAEMIKLWRQEPSRFIVNKELFGRVISRFTVS